MFKEDDVVRCVVHRPYYRVGDEYRVYDLHRGNIRVKDIDGDVESFTPNSFSEYFVLASRVLIGGE